MGENCGSSICYRRDLRAIVNEVSSENMKFVIHCSMTKLLSSKSCKVKVFDALSSFLVYCTVLFVFIITAVLNLISFF